MVEGMEEGMEDAEEKMLEYRKNKDERKRKSQTYWYDDTFLIHCKNTVRTTSKNSQNNVRTQSEQSE